MNLSRLVSHERPCKALTGLSVVELRHLGQEFSGNLQAYRATRKPKRQRKVGGGRKGHLPTALEKLVAILVYVKVYPTFDVMGVLFGASRTRCCCWVKEFLPVLEQTLDRRLDLPKRQMRSVEEFLQLFPELKDVFIDGTERPVQRPQNAKRRRKLYSGKKKSTTRKTIVTSDENRRILVLSSTKSGRRHDKKLADKANVGETLPPGVTAWLDTGFVGLEATHATIQIPKKRSKLHPLSAQDKANNRTISGIRVLSEHAVCGIKRMKAASDIYRNKRAHLDDTFMLVSAGLWNYHLSMAIT